jgi:hypothetical protein
MLQDNLFAFVIEIDLPAKGQRFSKFSDKFHVFGFPKQMK